MLLTSERIQGGSEPCQDFDHLPEECFVEVRRSVVLCVMRFGQSASCDRCERRPESCWTKVIFRILKLDLSVCERKLTGFALI